MLDRLSRDGFPEIARKRIRCGFPIRGVPFCGCPISRIFFEKWDSVPGQQLLADAEFRNHGFIPLGIVFLEVVEQATPLADQHEKAAARAVIFLVRLEVLRQLPNTLAEQGYLYFRAPGVAGMRAVLVNEGFLVLSG